MIAQALLILHFVMVPTGNYSVGKVGLLNNPPRVVSLNAYQISTCEVTNEAFEAFVNATGYCTDAERLHNAMVFYPPLRDFRWIKDPSANWRYPNGKKQGGIASKMRHPVVAISYRDAEAFCKWANVRLPTLDEWEVASRAGATTDYFFGKNLSDLREYANVWWGKDHLTPDYTDGYMWTAPVASFKPNPWGLYDVYGNVFEFCSGKLPSDRSPERVHSRGGSWWCSASTCHFFNSVNIGSVNRRASFSNLGFRVVK